MRCSHLLLPWLVLALGCNNSDTPSGTDLRLADTRAGDRLTSGDGSRDTVSVDTSKAKVSVDGKILSYYQGTGLSGVSICVYLDGKKTSSCTTSNANGEYKIDLPAETDAGVTLEKSGYWSGFLPIHAPAGTVTALFGTFTDAETTTEFANVGATYPDPGKGTISVNAMQGATFTLTPAQGAGPFYANTQGHLDKTLTAATQAGFGFVVGLAPGVYEVDVAHPSKSCSAGVAWPSAGKHSFRMPVIAGFWSGNLPLSCN